MVPNVAGSSPVIRPIIKRPEWGVFNFGRFGREPQVRNGTQCSERGPTKSPRAFSDWFDFVWELYSPVIRPINKSRVCGIFNYCTVGIIVCLEM